MPFLLLLLLRVLAVRSECQTVGQEFIVAFPENIAYYYPSQPVNKLRITVLHNDTEVTVQFQNSIIRDKLPLQSGDIKQVKFNTNVELDKTDISDKVVKVTSTKNIALEIFSQRNNSTQTALLLPTEQLGKKYRVPPIPQTHGTTVTNEVTERSRFKLIIVNNEDSNEISVEGTSTSFILNAGQVKQIWVEDEMVGEQITGTKPFLVLFGHPCTTQFECTCGVLYTPLEPSTSTKSNFIVPEVFKEGAADKTYLLEPSGGKSSQFSEGSLKVSGSLLLQRPGLLMNLIPEANFGSCFAIHTVSNATENWAVIVAPVAATGDVQIGNSPAPLTSADWKPVSGNKYKYAKVQLNSRRNFIWNKSDKMAVWFVAKLDHDVMFGNPAARLSVEPDYRGCVVTPEKLEVLPEKLSWKASIQACKKLNMSLITFPDEDFQKQVYKRLLSLNQNLKEAWMGMRQRSYTGDWYWFNEDFLNHTDWSHGFPRSDNDGRCARINLKDSNNPGWINKACCDPGRPVCYQPPELLTI